jgi:hypothetical protein
MKRFIFIIPMFLLFSFNLFAKDIQFQSGYTNDMFQSLVKELGVALAFNPMAPAEPLGITGFDVSAETVFTMINSNKKYWDKIFSDNDAPAGFPVPRLHAMKGLPFNIDVGAIYSRVPNTDINLLGFEVKYAILEGTALTPALAVRAAYSRIEGVDDLNLHTQQLDVIVSKGILFVTPYAGVTLLRATASESSDNVDLNKVHDTQFRGLVGVSVTPFPLLNFTLEGNFGKEVSQVGLKFGVRW